MLKPKKEITRKEIQRDPFLETIDQTQSHLQDNKSVYMKIGAGLIIFLLAFNVIANKRSKLSMDANGALGQALIALDRGDLSNAQFQLETLMSKYEDTESAEIAGYHLGKLYYDSGNSKDAKIYLNQYLNDQTVDIMVSSTALMLANISEKDGNAQEALSFLEKGIKMSIDTHTHRILTLEKAKLILSQGDEEQTKALAKGVLSEKNVTPVQKQVAEELLGKISG
jgi:predicted negative regulator of RcsB-dependent stress response